MKKINYKMRDIVFMDFKGSDFLAFLKKQCQKQNHDFDTAYKSRRKFKCGLENTQLPYDKIEEITYVKRDKSTNYAYEATKEGSIVVEVYISPFEFSPADMINVLERRQKLFS